MPHSFLFGTSASTIDRVYAGEAFLFADVADCMDYGYDHHQKAYLAVHAAEGSVLIVANPGDGRRYACDSGQQEHPPEDARRGVAVLCKPGEPVAFPVMQVDMVKGENGKQNSENYMHPYRPGISAGSGFKLDARYQQQKQRDAESAVA